MRFTSLMGEGLHRLPPRLHELLPPEQRADLRHRLGRFRPWEDGYDLAPPTLGPVETVGPPDFVGVGTLLGGARWWYRLIAEHPCVSTRDDIGMERHFLSHFCTDPFGDDEIERYHGWFPRRAGSIAGEWTPGYMAQPWVAPLLARAAPAARLLVMVRDPVERLRLGLARPSDDRTSQIGSHIADAVDRGFYARQLRRLLEFFPIEQVHVLQYEGCIADPMGQLEATYRFLHLDNAYRPPALLRSTRETTGSIPNIDADTTSRLVDLYASDVAELVTLVPRLDLSLWPAFVDDGSGPGAR
jgi:hypothetical protein